MATDGHRDWTVPDKSRSEHKVESLLVSLLSSATGISKAFGWRSLTATCESWTEETNLLILSQPLGVGFSYESRTEATYNGRGPYLLPYVNATSIDRSDLAAIATWHVVQEFLKKLPRISDKIKSKEFHLWTERYVESSATSSPETN
jgi:hypothetical protein